MNKNQENESTRKTMYTVAFVFMIISCCFAGWFLISLVWLIPMTIRMSKAMKEVGQPQERQHIALSVCSLIFASLIGGIFAIVGTCMFDPNQPNVGGYASNANAGYNL